MVRFVAFAALVLGILSGACATAAEEPVCGDGILSPGETCDDLNSAGGDGCSEQCELEVGFDCGGEPSRCTQLCGNGLLDPNEECDGDELDGQDCGSRGFDGGQLGCRADCSFDDRSCTERVCGDGVIEDPEGCDDDNATNGDGCGSSCQVENGWDCAGEPSICALRCGNGALDPGEQCDGIMLGGATCRSLSYDDGQLGCTDKCGFDESRCVLYSCGNGVIEGVEQCDDGNPTGADGCSATCQVEPGWRCTGLPSSCERLCGNGAIDAGEQCDGVDLGGATCASLGFVGGTLLCAQCSYDTSACIAPACGDGILSAGEECDDNNTNSGDGCNAACNVESGWECAGEPSLCRRLCGNGAIDAGEQCDGPNLGGASCVSLGYLRGSLACSPSCQFDTRSCVAPRCGDGILTPSAGEECDGSEFGGKTCRDFGFMSGALACTFACDIDSSGCTGPITVCGNGEVETGEDCDDGNTRSDDGCSSTCRWEPFCVADETIACGESDYTSRVSGNNSFNYSCGSTAAGIDHHYAFTAPPGVSRIDIDLDCDDRDDDYDIFVMEGACDPLLCIGKNTSTRCGSETVEVTPGLTYYIAIERDSALRGFRIRVDCD